MKLKTLNQELLFKFMSEHFNTSEPFTLDEMRLASGIRPGSFENYRSKQFGTLLIQSANGQFRISPAFRRFNTWEKFRDAVVSQKRRITRKYRPLGYQRVMSFEFFMPLRNEEWLREALDSLFFREEVQMRLRAIQPSELREVFPRQAQESEEAYLRRLCGWISKTFGGYSITHVSGRFKVGELMTRKEVADAWAAGTGRYLVDETTAVVRFIFPCGMTSAPEETSKNLADQIRWFFNKLFVEAILEVVNGEDEVWLLESGFCNQLQVFRGEN